MGKFNKPLKKWNTSNVTNLRETFKNATEFNQDISGWDTSNVSDIDSMFLNASNFDQDLRFWYLPNVVSEATDFATGTSIDVSKKPKWGEAPPSPFTITIKTDNNGATQSNEFKLTPGSGVFDYKIDWGDGVKELYYDNNDIIHTYETPGTYDISITGTFPHMESPSSDGDNDKIIDIKQWGDIVWESMENMFRNCSNLTGLSYSDAPDLSNVTSTISMFYNATNFNGNVSNWDVSSVTNMVAMFNGTNLFNQDLSSWNVSNVTNISQMFFNAKAFNQDLSSWNVSNVTITSYVFMGASSFNQPLNSWNTTSFNTTAQMFAEAVNFNQPLDNWDVSNVTSMSSMFEDATLFNQDLTGWCVTNIDSEPFNFSINSSLSEGNKPIWGTCPIDPDLFITTWQTDATGTTVSNSDQVKLPLDSGGTYNFTVDWGDGSTDTITSYNQAEATHTYAAVGSYDITIDGICEGWGFWLSGEDNSKLTGIKQWGDVKPHNSGYQFIYSNISSYTATDALNVSSVTNMEGMFYQATLPTGFDISGWNTSSVTNMTNLFYNATLPTGFDISGWNTSLVTNMSSMFFQVTLPTGFDISGWDTSSVTNMGSMFYLTTLLDVFDISGWNTSSVTNMSYMFYQATLPTGFDISGWDTSSVISMGNMFFNVTLPDPFDLSGWCVTNIDTEPSSFGNFNGTTQLQPIWGTCPGV